MDNRPKQFKLDERDKDVSVKIEWLLFNDDHAGAAVVEDANVTKNLRHSIQIPA